MSNWIDIEIKPPTKNNELKYECKLCNLRFEELRPNFISYLECKSTPIVIKNDVFFNRFVVVNSYLYGTIYCYKEYE